MARDLSKVEKAVLHHPDPVVSAPEIADELDVSRRSVLDDLRLLERSDVVESKKVGGNAVAWYHTDRVTRAPPRSPADHPDQAGLKDTVEQRDVGTLEPDDVDVVAPDQDDDRGVEALDPELVDALESWDPGQGSRERRERVAAGVRTLEWLRERPDALVARSRVVDALYPELALEDQSADTYWRKIARPAFKHAAESGLVKIVGRKYRWDGDQDDDDRDD